MELWAWLVGYVVLFVVLHLVLYYAYLRRDEDGAGSPTVAEPDRLRSQTSPGPDSYPPAGDDPEQSDHPTDDVLHCPHCGAANVADPTYTYCWQCISTLRQ